MSAKYTFLAWDTPITSAPLKLALLQLANNADDNGFSYYSISKMATSCGMSERTFMRKIAELEAMKVLSVERRPNRPSLYTLIGDEMGVTLCHLQHSEVTECHGGVTESHLVGDRESHDPNNTPKSNLNNIYQQIADEWNKRFEGSIVPTVKAVSEKRKAAINGCIKQMNNTEFDFSIVETWSRLFDHAIKSDFLMGRETNWKMDFDFITNKSKLLKVVEGGYDNKH